MTIQLKAIHTEQNVLVVLLIVLYKVNLTFETVDEILKFTLQDFIQMKAAEQYFAVVL